MPAQDLASIAQHYVHALNNKDLSAIETIYAADATVEDPVGSEPIQGMEAILAFYARGMEMGLSLALSGTVRVAGNSIAFPFIINMDAGGQKTRIEVIDVFDFNAEGKVVSMRAYWGPENTTVA